MVKFKRVPRVSVPVGTGEPVVNVGGDHVRANVGDVWFEWCEAQQWSNTRRCILCSTRFLHVRLIGRAVWLCRPCALSLQTGKGFDVECVRGVDELRMSNPVKR